jgi:transcriptional regulator with XRE-family HTH domain
MNDRAQLRKRAGLTQLQLARLVGISAPRFCMWEKGQMDLRKELVDRIAKTLLDYLGKAPSFSELQELVQYLGTSTEGDAKQNRTHETSTCVHA